MLRLLLPLLGAAAVGLAAIAAATASTGTVVAGPPVNGSRATTVASTSSSGVASGSPALVLSNASRPVVHGLHFAKGERVKVTFRAGGHALARTVRVRTTGSFALTAPASLAYDPCSIALVVVARGKTGDAVTVRRPPRGCAPG
jgi:hypothetical protein